VKAPPGKRMTPGPEPNRGPRLLYLALSTRLGPTSRYRIYQYQDQLAAAGIRLHIAPALGDSYFRADRRTGWRRKLQKLLAGAWALWRRLSQLWRIVGADLVVIERELFPRLPPLIETLLRLAGKRFVLELDDAVYLSPGRTWYYAWTVKCAARVIVGNPTLAEHVRGLNANVVVIPTSVEVARYTAKTGFALHRPARLGWVGLPSNFVHLDAIAPALRDLCRDLGALLVVVSARPPTLDVPFEFVPWDERNEPAAISTFDVGLMPLWDTPFARGKCGLKLLQYMAAAVPAIASPVGVNTTIIRHGENGLLASSTADWVARLTELIRDEALRARLGRAGRATVEQRYSLEIVGRQLVDFYRRI
jgi:glycosyltransferase involved in cell wall biosynthesis